MKKIFGLILLSIMLAVILTSVVVFVSAVTYTYNTLYLGNDVNGDPMYKAVTNDVVGMAGGKVRFWLRYGTECPPPRDDISPFIDLMLEGGDLVAYYTFVGYGDTVVTVRAKFLGEQYSVWGNNVTVPWFTSLPVAMLVTIGGVTIFRKRIKNGRYMNG